MSSLPLSIEESACLKDIEASQDEADILHLDAGVLQESVLLLVQGFEERSVGLIEKLAAAGIRVNQVVIAEYRKQRTPANELYRERMTAAAAQVSQNTVKRTACQNDSDWVKEALKFYGNRPVMLDITGVSNRAMFGVLDEATVANSIRLCYTEAQEYWPTSAQWARLKKQFSAASDMTQLIDNQPWLFGPEHHHELIAGFQGYDSAAANRALLAFLPFKAARLAAVMREQYATTTFVAGMPHLPENSWRYEALLTINREIVGSHPVLKMPTFGYRKAARQLLDILFGENGLLLQFDVHLAPLGSKLQEVACWLVCRHIPGITVATSVPTKYFTKAFSKGRRARLGPSSFVWINPHRRGREHRHTHARQKNSCTPH